MPIFIDCFLMVNGSFESATGPDSADIFSILAISALFRRARHHPLLKYISSQESELKISNKSLNSEKENLKKTQNLE